MANLNREVNLNPRLDARIFLRAKRLRYKYGCIHFERTGNLYFLPKSIKPSVTVMKEVFFTNSILLVLLAAAVYFGIGGMGRIEYKSTYEDLLTKKPDTLDKTAVVIDGVSYPNKLEMQRGEMIQQIDQFNKIFIWVNDLPDLINLIITACAFSLIGALANLLFDWLANKQVVRLVAIFYYSLLGFMCGLFIIGLSYIIPKAIIKTDTAEIRPITLMFLSLFAGFCFLKFYAKLSGFFDQLFIQKSEK